MCLFVPTLFAPSCSRIIRAKMPKQNVLFETQTLTTAQHVPLQELFFPTKIRRLGTPAFQGVLRVTAGVWPFARICSKTGRERERERESPEIITMKFSNHLNVLLAFSLPMRGLACLAIGTAMWHIVCANKWFRVSP